MSIGEAVATVAILVFTVSMLVVIVAGYHLMVSTGRQWIKDHHHE
jgi:hypothetical protein